MDFSMVGPGLVLGLGCIGSSIGCAIASMASHGVMSRVDEGHAKFMIMAAMPASQIIYGFILMLFMRAAILAGTLSPLAGVGLGLFEGLAIAVSSVYQGKCAATAIQATAKQPGVFGKGFVSLGMIEGFGLFVLVFTIMLLK